MTTPDAPIARLRALAEKATRPQFMVDAGVDYSVRWTREQQGQAVAFQMARQQLRSAMEEFGPDLLAAVEAAWVLMDYRDATSRGWDWGGRPLGELVAAQRAALDKLYRPAGGEEAGNG